VLFFFCLRRHRDLSKVHRLRYQGEIAVMVTQGETIYISEIEKLCSNISLNENFFGLQDSNHLLSNSAFTEKFQRLNPIQPHTKKGFTKSMDGTNNPFTSSMSSTSSGSAPTLPNAIKPPPRVIGKDDESDEEDGRSTFFDPLYRPPPSQINPWVYSLVLLLPLRLGINSVNEEYISVSSYFLFFPSLLFISFRFSLTLQFPFILSCLIGIKRSFTKSCMYWYHRWKT
jgi:hypothetical protein